MSTEPLSTQSDGPPIPREDAIHLLDLAVRWARNSDLPREEIVKHMIWNHDSQKATLQELIAKGLPEEAARELLAQARERARAAQR